MIQSFRKIFSLLLGFLVCLPAVLQAQTDETVITQDMLGGRKALVGPGCVVNQFATNVQLLSGISGLENLVDEDLDNYATFTTGVAVGVTEQPLFSVKDMNHTYAAGTEAGICMVSSESGGLLSLNVIQLFTIRAYNNGKLIATYPVSSGQAGSGVGLDLIKIPGTDNMAVNLTCTPEEDFDELYVDISGGLDVSVIKELKFKYAFVGKPRQCQLTTNGLKKYAAETGQAGEGGAGAVLTPKGAEVPVLLPVVISEKKLEKLVDDDLSNSCSVTNVLSIGYKGAVKLSTDPEEPICGIPNNSPDPTVVFPAGSEVGFVYQNASALNLKLGNYVEIKIFNTDGTTQTEMVEAGVLSLVVGEGGKMTSSVIAEKEFYAAEIGFYTAISANLGNLAVYYGFINEAPDVPHHCAINSSAGAELCETQSSYQLLSNPSLAVEWKLISAKYYGTDTDIPADLVSVTSSGKVTFHDGGESIPGEYVFEATSVGCTHTPKCTERVVIRRGINSYDAGCSEPVFNDGTHNDNVLSDDIYGSSGALISISDITNSENILDGDLTNYATYTGGLSVANNLRVIGVKKQDQSLFTVSSETDGKKVNKRVGFLVESKSTFLNADVLQFFQIRCYRKGKEVYRKLIDESNAVGVGLIQGDQSQKVRFSIEVPAYDDDGNPIEFDEFMLWTAGVLKLDISVLNIYYPFIEDASMNCGDPLKCAEMISVDNGATAYPDMKFQTASIAGVVQNLGYLIDNDPNTYFLYQNTVQAGSGMVVSVKLGKTLDYRHQFGIIMDSQTFLAGVALGTWMTVETYYNGQPTGDKFSNWGVLGLDVIGYGDKSYLINTPTRNFDEVRITFAGIANVLNGYKLYGLFIRGDKNLNGIPDCMDPDCNCRENLSLEVSKVCVGDEIYLSGTVKNDESEVIVSAPDQMVKTTTEGGEEVLEPFQKTVPVVNGGFHVMIPTSTAGSGLNIMVYGKNGDYLDAVTYTVHPNRTEWRKNPLNTDWNEPNNWTGNVEPYCCTDVIIPDGAALYPVLENRFSIPGSGSGIAFEAENYCCNGIYFQSSVEADEDNPAQVVNIPELAYNKAWVDVRMMPNRYYMFSAPLKNTYTGDLFVPEAMKGIQTGNEFEDLNQVNTPQNRLNPSIYQRMWKTNPNVRLLDELSYPNGVEHRNDVYVPAGFGLSGTDTHVAEWSNNFNRMAQPYTSGQGFSVWVDNGKLSADSPVIMRLPKQHTVYNYYTPDGILLPEHDGQSATDGNTSYSETVNLDRTDNSRFIYEAGQLESVDPNYPDSKRNIWGEGNQEAKLVVQAVTESGTSSFAVGNPFMSDVDIKTFLTLNTDIKSLRRYDGNTYISYSLDATTGDLISNDPMNRKNVIHPLESFFVDLDTDGGNKTDVVFNQNMMLEVAQNTTSVSAADDTHRVRLSVSSGAQKASVLFADSLSDVHVESLLDSDVKPSLAVFAALDNKAYDMVSTAQGDIPLGIIAGDQDTLTLQLSGTSAELADWELVDRKENRSYSLAAPVLVSRAGISVGRFVLRSRSRSVDSSATDARMYASYSGNGQIQVVATAGEIASLEVFTASGVLFDKQTPHAASSRIRVPSDAVILVRATTDSGAVETWKMMIPAF